MIETIGETYGQYGYATDLSQLIAATVLTPQDKPLPAVEYGLGEQELFDSFTTFLADRPVAATKEYHAAFGTVRWAVTASNPIVIVGSSSGHALRAVPFVEQRIVHGHGNHPSDHSSPSKESPPRSDGPRHTRAIGVYLTAMSVNRLLRHRVVSRPWAGDASKRIGVVRRSHIDHPALQSSQEITPPRGNQQKFIKFIQELIEWEKKASD